MHLPIGLDFPLEHVELDRILGQLVGQAILSGQGGEQALAVRDGEVVLDLRLFEGLPLFVGELLAHVRQLPPQACTSGHLGPNCAVAVASFCSSADRRLSSSFMTFVLSFSGKFSRVVPFSV